MQVKIREATRADAAELVALVRALNEHQGDPTEYFDMATLERDLFGANPSFGAFVAEHGRELAGYAFFLPAYETGYAARGLYLCDLYVMPERRRRGIGRALVAAVALRARQDGRGFLWWASRAWNDEAKRFYAALGAKTEPVNAHALTFDAFETLAKEGERRSAA